VLATLDLIVQPAVAPRDSLAADRRLLADAAANGSGALGRSDNFPR
jgi:hypothetical protein